MTVHIPGIISGGDLTIKNCRFTSDYIGGHVTITGLESPQLGGEVVIEQEVTLHCVYCHGITTNDYLGNCAACGGPRKKVQPFIPQATLYGQPVTDEDAAAFIMGESKLEVNSRWGGILEAWKTWEV